MYTIFQKTLETRYEHLISNANNISLFERNAKSVSGYPLVCTNKSTNKIKSQKQSKIIICLTIVSPPTNCWHKWQLLVNAKCHLTLLFKPRMYFYDCLNTTFWTSIVWAQFVCFLVLKGINAVLTHWLTHNQHADSRIMCDPDA